MQAAEEEFDSCIGALSRRDLHAQFIQPDQMHANIFASLNKSSTNLKSCMIKKHELMKICFNIWSEITKILNSEKTKEWMNSIM